jgi:hypothetical protein
LPKTVEVIVPRKQRPWFARRRAFPAQVVVHDEQHVTWAGIDFSLVPLADGFVAVRKRAKAGGMSLGEFSLDTVRHTLSENAGKDVRVIRAAVLGQRYEVPIAVELADGAWVHPGICQKKRSVEEKKRYLRLEDEELHCEVCGESFE